MSKPRAVLGAKLAVFVVLSSTGCDGDSERAQAAAAAEAGGKADGRDRDEHVTGSIETFVLDIAPQSAHVGAYHSRLGPILFKAEAAHPVGLALYPGFSGDVCDTLVDPIRGRQISSESPLRSNTTYRSDGGHTPSEWSGADWLYWDPGLWTSEAGEWYCLVILNPTEGALVVDVTLDTEHPDCCQTGSSSCSDDTCRAEVLEVEPECAISWDSWVCEQAAKRNCEVCDVHARAE